jgi:hypothetical protein
MSGELEAFHQEFFQEVIRSADANGNFAEDSFFELFTEHLIEAGELETADRAQFLGPRGVRVDGYGGDPAYSEGTLSLIISDFSQEERVLTLTATEMDAAFKRATAFLTKSLDSAFRRSLEETSAGFGLADLIAQSWDFVSKVRLILISNRVLSARVDGRTADEYRERPIAYSVWDLGRLHRYMKSGRSREDVILEMEDHGGPLAALPAHLNDAGYEAYLVVIPATQLASIYGRWGSRLLEQNVRVFLQAKNNVNKGIRNTIENDPEMFFAYNNGITATAEELITGNERGSLQIKGMRNLQIVNGGQTTASIYAAKRKQVDLSKVFVQMKLSIIPPEKTETVVPKISEYANSQNKVNAADFFANHPFHLRVKEFSQTVFAPAPEGTFRQSKWFYERARGQYQDGRNSLTGTAQKNFDLEFPKSQVFTKTDLAKFLNVWRGFPEIVSRGAQKNFAQFAEYVGKAWTDNPDLFNEVYYRQAIAKAIVFRETESLVTEQAWYEAGGYRANIVAYAIAKLAHDVDLAGKAIDLEIVWRAQKLPPSLEKALAISAKAVKDVITNPPLGTVKNVTEWAKQPACWAKIKTLRVEWPTELRQILISKGQLATANREAVKDQKILNGIEAQTAVVNAGAKVWRDVLAWGIERKHLSGKEIEILEVAVALPNKVPSDKQSLIIIKTLQRLRTEGCPLGAGIA